jgi:putative DNA primase/helicase
MNAREATLALGGRWRGSHGQSACPVCQPERRADQNALSISDGAGVLLTYCHKSNCDFRDILDGAGIGDRRDLPWPRVRSAKPNDATDRIAAALRLWAETRPIAGTLGATYLESRGLSLDGARDVRFHPNLRFDGTLAPGVVALFRDAATDEPCGIHRTFLRPDGTKIERRMLGRASHAAVQLDAGEGVTTGLAIVEGVETGLAARGTFRPVWALGSAGAVGRFPVLGGVECLTIYADADPTGQAAAVACAERWAAAGAEVHVMTPAAGDVNDMLREVAQ